MENLLETESHKEKKTSLDHKWTTSYAHGVFSSGFLGEFNCAAQYYIVCSGDHD